MKSYFTNDEDMFKTSYKYSVKVISPHGEEYIVPFYHGFVCPKCGRRVYFADKKTGNAVHWFSEIYENGICIDKYNLHHNMICDEPLYKYKCIPIIETEQTFIGKFRTSPVSIKFYKRTRKHSTKNYYIDRDWTAKGYKLKYDTCYVEPIYESDEDDDSYYIPTVKFRKCNPKTNGGARRSSGWKSNKKKIKQWY